MERVRDPPELILDENDDHLIFEIPTDPNDNQSRQQQRNRDLREKQDPNTSVSPTKAGKLPHKDNRGRVTRKVLTGSGLLKETEDHDDDGNDQTNSPKNDFWNLSNDEYYNPRLIDSVGKNLGSLNLQVRTSTMLSLLSITPSRSACDASRRTRHSTVSHAFNRDETAPFSSTDHQEGVAWQIKTRRVSSRTIDPKNRRYTSRSEYCPLHIEQRDHPWLD